MKGILENFPCDSKTAGESGTIPFSPSITGTNANSWGDAPCAIVAAASISLGPADRRHAKVLLGSLPLHSGTAAAKICQSCEPLDAAKSGVVAWDPDSNIYQRVGMERCEIVLRLYRGSDQSLQLGVEKEIGDGDCTCTLAK